MVSSFSIWMQVERDFAGAADVKTTAAISDRSSLLCMLESIHSRLEPLVSPLLNCIIFCFFSHSLRCSPKHSYGEPPASTLCLGIVFQGARPETSTDLRCKLRKKINKYKFVLPLFSVLPLS